jgi:hypothetical protein
VREPRGRQARTRATGTSPKAPYRATQATEGGLTAEGGWPVQSVARCRHEDEDEDKMNLHGLSRRSLSHGRGR